MRVDEVLQIVRRQRGGRVWLQAVAAGERHGVLLVKVGPPLSITALPSNCGVAEFRTWSNVKLDGTVLF